jgi:hypothetical protein
MKNRLFVIAMLLAVFVMVASAADVTGKWTAEVPGREGAVRTMTMNLKASGETLTGTITGGGRGGAATDREISEGKISGDDISFVVKMEMGGNAVKMIYTGKVAGSEIKFKSQREGGERTTEFTAKKAN